MRLLTSIQETAVGADAPSVSLPPVELTYGTPAVDLSVHTTTGQWIDPQGVETARNLGWGYRWLANDDRWPTVEAMMLDVDGDGLADRVFNASGTTNGVTSCKAYWQRNVPGGGFAAEKPLTWGNGTNERMPMLRWNGPGSFQVPGGSAEAGAELLEGCALNGQVTAFKNSHPNPGACHDADQTPCTVNGFCPDGRTCPYHETSHNPNPRTYLAYRWMDMDNDGLVDLVAAVHGDVGNYDIIRGNDIVGGHLIGFEPDLFGTVNVQTGFPPCNEAPPICSALGSDCLDGTVTCQESAPACVYDWAAINACVAAADEHECEFEIGDKHLYMLPQQDPQNQGPTPASHSATRFPYQMCYGRYPWFIFKNRGNGEFDDTPIIKYQPLPLESDSGDSSIVSVGVAAQNHGILDIDGDGRVDGIARGVDNDGNSQAAWWQIWANDGTGGLAHRFYVPHRLFAHNAISGFNEPAQQGMGSTSGLFDLNGDGLADHWIATSSTANIALNNGTGFELVYPPWAPTGAINTLSVKPGTETLIEDAVVEQPLGNIFFRSGTRFAANRPVDVDQDGRVDVVRRSGGEYFVHYNHGAQLANIGAPYQGNTVGVRNIMRGDEDDLVPDALTWAIQSDLADLDGDGIPESISWTHVMHHHKHSTANGPPRLLVGIKNGRGAETTVAYASMHEPATVTQNPGELWFDDRPKASPHNQWVVKSLTTTDTFAGTTAVTGYFYKNPRHGADDEDRYSFRGFEEVRTTAPSGAVTVQRYSYTPDWSGRLAETLVHPAEAPSSVHTIDKTTWSERTLFAGAIRTYHATLAARFVCANGQTESQCLAAPAAYSETGLVPAGTPQRLYPHCKTCSARQGGEVRAERARRKKEEKNEEKE